MSGLVSYVIVFVAFVVTCPIGEVSLLIALAFLSGALFAESVLSGLMESAAQAACHRAIQEEREFWLALVEDVPGSLDWRRVAWLVRTYGWDVEAWEKQIPESLVDHLRGE